MGRVLIVHVNGFFAWLKNPLSKRALKDARQTELIRQAWTDSGKVYGYRKLTDELRDQGNRFPRTGSPSWPVWPAFQRRLDTGGAPVDTEPRHLWSPQKLWIGNSVSTCLTGSGTIPCSPLVREQWSSDITYIKTHEGWLYLSVVIDLLSWRVVGWSAQPRMTTKLALQALLTAV